MLLIRILFMLLAITATTAHAEAPPLIGDVPRVTRPEASTPPSRDSWWVKQAAAHHAEPADGPMCAAPIQEEYDGPSPTHYGVLVMEPATEAESIEVAHQIASCTRGVKRVADPFLVLAILRLESDLGVPKEVRGLLGAAMCWESAMRTKPRVGDIGMSHGSFQMGGWAWGQCRLPMTDNVMYNVPVAATCYWQIVQSFLDDGRCPGNVRRAEAMAANAKKYGKRSRGHASFVRDVSQSEIGTAIRRGDVKRIFVLATLIQKKQDVYCNGTERSPDKVESLHWEELQRWRAKH